MLNVKNNKTYHIVVLIESLVMSRRDYSNGLFYGLPKCTVYGCGYLYDPLIYMRFCNYFPLYVIVGYAKQIQVYYIYTLNIYSSRQMGGLTTPYSHHLLEIRVRLYTWYYVY